MQLKSVRLPRKFDGGHRGFAFVEYLTRKEAKLAFEALGSSHFYGRHLVVEWAQDAEGVDAAVAKAQKDAMRLGEDGSARKRRRQEFEDGGVEE